MILPLPESTTQHIIALLYFLWRCLSASKWMRWLLSASFMEPVLVPYPTMYISVVERRETPSWDEFGVWRTCFLHADGIRKGDFKLWALIVC